MRVLTRNGAYEIFNARLYSRSKSLVMPQSQMVQAAGSKPTSMTLNVFQKTIDMNSTYQIKVKTVKLKKRRDYLQS